MYNIVKIFCDRLYINAHASTLSSFFLEISITRRFQPVHPVHFCLIKHPFDRYSAERIESYLIQQKERKKKRKIKKSKEKRDTRTKALAGGPSS